MVDLADIEISDINRECIACPASWSGTTTDGGNVYVRFRGGRLSLRYRDQDEEPINKENDSLESTYVSRENEVFEDSNFESFDGHMDVFELREYLRSKGVKFLDCLKEEFYDGLEPEECEFLLVGDWFVSADCEECNWSVDHDSVEKVEFETVLPKSCPECNSELQVSTEKPERLEGNF